MAKIFHDTVKLCANFDGANCIFDHPCNVKGGKLCSYFEQTVLRELSPEYQFSRYDRNKEFCDKVLKAYRSISNPAYFEQDDFRKCKCGARLKPRRRYCDQCRDAARRSTRKRYGRKSNADS